MLKTSIATAKRVFHFLAAQQLVVILIPLLVIIGGWSFVEITEEVMEGDTQRIDERIVESMRNADDPNRPLGPTWLQEAALEVTALGSIAVLSIATLFVLGYLALSRLWRHMLFLAITVAGGTVVSLLLKSWVGRERPSIVPHLANVHTQSFPSGHAMLSAVVWLTLGALLAELETQRSRKSYIYGAALTIALLVGTTRVYLGVHYPTDVLAGWTAGLVWAMAIWWSARLLRKRHVLDEKTVQDTRTSRGDTQKPDSHAS